MENKKLLQINLKFIPMINVLQICSRKTRESQQADMAQRSAKDEKKRQRAQNFVLSQQQSYMEKVENNIEKQYMDQLRNQKIADKNANFMDKTAKMFNDRKVIEAQALFQLSSMLNFQYKFDNLFN